MSGVVFNAFEKSSSFSPVGSVGEVIFYASQSINNNFSAPISVPINLPASTSLNLTRLGETYDAYFVLKSLTISTRKSPSFADKHRGAAFQINQFTIPGSTSSPETIYFSNATPTFFSHVLFVVNVAANFTVDTMSVQEHNSGNLYPTGLAVAAPFATAGPQLNLQNLFDPIDGLINFSQTNPGFDLGFTAHNTNAGAAILDVSCFGSTYAYDWIQMLIQYQDWKGRMYNVGVFDDRAFSQPYQLGQRVPEPIDNPNQTAFGNIILTNLGFNSFFNPSYTYDFELAGAVEYLPAGSY